MTLAIFGVVFYHLALRGIPIGRLNIGYMGVDVFMLLSGYGIGKSLSHNSISKFYENRIRRILPIWVLMIFFSSLISVSGGVNKLYLTDLMFNLTTLSFYFNPDLLPEWYLATLILFYALSPLLFKLEKVIGWYGVVLAAIAVVGISEFSGLVNTWQYANAICRFPLYLLGIQCAISNKDNLSYYVTVPCFAIGCYFFFCGAHYLFSSCCVLLSIQVANLLIDRLGLDRAFLVKKVGRHTLEIYAANVLSAVFIESCLKIQSSVFAVICVDLLLTLLFTIALWKLNKLISLRI